MEKETFYGKYGDVDFYGVGQLSFVYWCVTNNVVVQNNPDSRVMKTEDGLRSLKPIFFLPEYDLYLDVRSGQNPNKYRRNYEYNLRADISKANPNFTYLLSEKIGTLNFLQARKLVLEDDSITISSTLETKLNILTSKERITLDRISMPRWFRTQLADIRKSRNEVAAEA